MLVSQSVGVCRQVCWWVIQQAAGMLVGQTAGVGRQYVGQSNSLDRSVDMLVCQSAGAGSRFVGWSNSCGRFFAEI